MRIDGVSCLNISWIQEKNWDMLSALYRPSLCQTLLVKNKEIISFQTILRFEGNPDMVDFSIQSFFRAHLGYVRVEL
jgi:hypothetical protein